MFAAVLAVVEAIPALKKIFFGVVDLYFKRQAAVDEATYDAKKTARNAILFAMKQTGVTDEELKNYRRSLYDLNH